MKTYIRFLCLLLVVLVCLPLSAKDVPVRGYTRKDGTYVKPHVRSSPNSTKSDNYSTRGNVNPYTGKAGTKPGDAPATVPAADAKTEATPAATNVQPEATVAPRPPAANLALVTPGMTKEQVAAAIGRPNIESAALWAYTGSGWVRFKNDRVSNVEKR